MSAIVEKLTEAAFLDTIIQGRKEISRHLIKFDRRHLLAQGIGTAFENYRNLLDKSHLKTMNDLGFIMRYKSDVIKGFRPLRWSNIKSARAHTGPRKYMMCLPKKFLVETEKNDMLPRFFQIMKLHTKQHYRSRKLIQDSQLL